MRRLRLYRSPSLLHALAPRLLWRKPVREKVIYLTFDDGPHVEVTPWILDCLRTYDARATFFCVGANAAELNDLTAAITAERHKLGNHTHHHLNGWRFSSQAYLADVNHCNEWLGSPWFRPPYGKIKPRQAQRLRQAGYTIVMWNVLTYDFDKTVNPEEALNAAIYYTSPGSVVVFHDNPKAFANMRTMLPLYLRHFREKGYQFQTL